MSSAQVTCSGWRAMWGTAPPTPFPALRVPVECLLQNATAASVTVILSPPDKVHSAPRLSLQGAFFYFQSVWNQALAQGGWAELCRTRTAGAEQGVISHSPAGICDVPRRRIEGRSTKPPPAWLCLSPGLPANCRQREKEQLMSSTTATLPGFLH